MVALVLAAAAVAVFLVLPGALAAWLLGLRLWIAFALGAPLHLGFLALLMQLFGWAQIAWALPGVVVADLVALALLAAAAGNAGLSRGGGGWAASGAPSGAYFAWDWRLAPLSFPSVALWRRNLLWIAAVLVALCAAGVFQAAPFLQTLPNAGAPTQSFDAMFHYSGAKIIAQTQDASWRGSLDPLYVTPGINKYYPNQWHALVALFAPWASLSLVSNALLLALTCVVWPLGVGLMADYAFCASGQAYRNWAVPLAILLSPAPLVFPYYLGVLQALYPYVLALTWWPGALWGLWRGADLISLSIATRRHHAASAAASSATATSTTLADAPSSTTATAASSAYSLRSTRARPTRHRCGSKWPFPASARPGHRAALPGGPPGAALHHRFPGPGGVLCLGATVGPARVAADGVGGGGGPGAAGRHRGTGGAGSPGDERENRPGRG